MATVEEDINCEAGKDHTDDDDDDGDRDGDGDDDGTSSRTIPTETKYNKGQIKYWNKMFRKLVDYKQKHQTTKVPYTCKDDPPLGLWVSTQRKNYKKENVSKHRVGLLDSIGFVWRLHEYVPWIEMYQRLITYKKQHKSTSVPKCYKEDQNLGRWVDNQRSIYKSKKLSVERINYLESIGFVWKFHNRGPPIPWIEMYERLVIYKQHHQSTLVPQTYKEDARLGRWVATQRVAYNKDELSEKRMELLNSISFA